MALDPWYRVAQPREEVREGRSFNPDEFAIALEQVVGGTAPIDYRDPAAFFARTCFTRALREHAGMVLRRLAGKTANTSPVMTLVTQFGGGKTHTLTALYHVVTGGETAGRLNEVAGLLRDAGLSAAPEARVAVFVGNAWDPREGREAPWIDVARQLAGDRGVELIGASSATTPPGTEALGRVFAAAGAPVLVLFDEVLNFVNRYRRMADPFHAFIQNLTVAMTGTTHGAAVISLPRSQVEMSDFDMAWQNKITKVVRRVAKDLLANDETEVSEVVRRRLFDQIGQDRFRKKVSRIYADWCFERRAQLPPQWTLVDSAATEAKAREHLRARFDACYPFHPATLSVFQRKWSALPQFQQTRGTLAMLAQWISWAHQDAFRKARLEPLITLGSAPLDVSDFASVVLGQLGESRLSTAIDADIAGVQAHARAGRRQQGCLPLRGHRRRFGTGRGGQHRPRRRSFQQQREPLWTRDLGPQVERPAQRIGRRRIPRTQLAAGVEGRWHMAARQSAPELPRRIADPSGRSRRRAVPEDRRVRRKRRLRARLRKGSGRSIRARVVPGDRLARGRHVRVGRLPADPGSGRRVAGCA